MILRRCRKSILQLLESFAHQFEITVVFLGFGGNRGHSLRPKIDLIYRIRFLRRELMPRFDFDFDIFLGRLLHFFGLFLFDFEFYLRQVELLGGLGIFLDFWHFR